MTLTALLLPYLVLPVPMMLDESALTRQPFVLDQVITAVATDLDGDGVPRFDQMRETGCYDGSRILFRPDGTFRYKITTVLVDYGSGVWACGDHQVTGTWEIRGNGIRMTYEDEDENDIVLDAAVEGGFLFLRIPESTYPERDQDGIWRATTGAVEYIFKKATP